MKKKLITIALLLLLNNANGTTLEEVLKLAVENNPQIKEAKEETKITKAQYKEAISEFFPKVTLQYAKTHLSDVPTFSMGRFEFSTFEKNFYNFKVTAWQPLFMGGKLILNKEIRKNLHTASFYLFQETLNRVLVETKKDFFLTVEAKNQVKITKEFYRAALEHYKTVKAFYDEGIVARRDLLEAEVNLKKAEESLERARNFYKTVLEKLKEDTNYTLNEVKIPERVKVKQLELSIKELKKLAISSRPILKALKLEKEAAEKGVKLSYASFSPDLFLTFSYERNNQYPMNSNLSYTQASIVLSLPIFEGGKRFFKIEEAKAQKRKIVYNYERVKNQVKLQVVSAYLKLKTAEKRIETAKTMVKEAEKLLKDSKERYKEHVGTSTEVVDAIAYLTKAKSTLNSALADYNKALADLEYAVGKSLR